MLYAFIHEEYKVLVQPNPTGNSKFWMTSLLVIGDPHNEVRVVMLNSNNNENTELDYLLYALRWNLIPIT